MMASQKLVKEPNAKHTSEGKNTHAHIFHSPEIFLYIRLLLRFAELPDKYKCVNISIKDVLMCRLLKLGTKLLTLRVVYKKRSISS